MSLSVYNSLLNKELAIEVEKLLISVFKYGNYDFKKALSGWDNSGLQTIIALCMENGVLKGAALSLYSENNPDFAIFGPIAVYTPYRGSGIGSKLLSITLDSLKTLKVREVLIGVKEDHPARRLYKKFGFKHHTGVVMRKLLYQLPCDCYARDLNSDIHVRDISWADYPDFQSFFIYPFAMRTFDHQIGYLSSKYAPVSKFLVVFPELKEMQREGKLNIKVLSHSNKQKIVGIAKSSLNKCVDSNEFLIDFIIHDDFLQYSPCLINKMIETNPHLNSSIYSYCLKSDNIKKEVLIKTGFVLQSQTSREVKGMGQVVVQKFKHAGIE